MRIKTLLPLAFALCIGVLSGCGKASTIYYDAAVNYMDTGHYAQAAIDFKRSLDEEAATRDCYRGYGIALFYEGRYDEAAEAFINALHASNGAISRIDYDINEYLAKSYELGGHYEEAISVYSALITLLPKETDHYYRRGLCYLKMGDLLEATVDFKVVTSAYPDDYDLHLDIFFAARQADYEEWAYTYLEGILTDGDRKISDYDRGRLYYHLGNYSDARVYLEKAKDMTNPDTVLMLGKTYEAIKDYNYAASLYNTYLSTKGSNVAIYNQLGVCRLNNGDYENALSAFQMGLSLNEAEYKKELLYNEAVTYEYLLDFNTAYEKMAAYVKLYPEDLAAAHELDFLSTRKN